MRLLGYFAGACVALALLQAAVKLVLVAGIAMLIWLGITRPTQTIGFLLAFTALALIGNYPVAGLAVFGILGIAGMINSK